MGDVRRVRIERLNTGVPGLDEVIGGGLPRYSFNLIAGGPGTGKTTLAHQILFGNVCAEQPALYFTVVGEPPIKMLRYQQQMSFFDAAKIGETIHFVNLGHEVLEDGLDAVLDSIEREVQQVNPGIVAVDSFRTVVRATRQTDKDHMDLQSFAQRLAMFLAAWQATTFLVGEYKEEKETQESPVFTVADDIIWLCQAVERNSVVRKLQVMKMRGQAPQPGLHTFRITQDGIRVFPRIPQRDKPVDRTLPRPRLSTGVSGLDQMMGGGIPAGDAVLVAGSAGSGKSVLATQFIADGVKQGEPGVIVVFEEYPEEYAARAKGLGFDLEEMIGRGNLGIIYLRPLDLSVDETLYGIRETVARIGAKRVIIDSVSGFEMALAPTFRDDFHESLYRLVGALAGNGVTLLLTLEVTETYGGLCIGSHLISFLTDDVLLLRHVQMDGKIRKVMAVIKMRSSDHSDEVRTYEITSRGLVVGEALAEYGGIVSGYPHHRDASRGARYPILSPQEALVCDALMSVQRGNVELLAQATGLQRPVLKRAIDRLVELGLVGKAEEEGEIAYHWKT